MEDMKGMVHETKLRLAVTKQKNAHAQRAF